MEANPKSDGKPITFILQPDGVTTGSNKSRINAYIAAQAHQRRRNRRERLQVAKKIEVLPFQAHPSNSRYDEMHKNTPLTRAQVGENHRNFQIVSHPTKYCGNSDPFAATPIRVTSQISHLLTFTRDRLLPSLHGVEGTFPEGPLLISMWWKDVIDGLQGVSAGYAYLSRSAGIMNTIAGSAETRLMALTFRDRASAALRNELMQGSTSSAKALCWSISALLSAELATHNFAAAQVHGQMLRKFLQPQAGEKMKRVELEKRFLMAILSQDVTRATLSLSRPSFDLDRWEVENLPGSILDDTYSNVPSLFPMENELDSSLSSQLSFIFVGIRKWLLAFGMVMINPKIFTQELHLNGAMRLMILEGNLINNYLNAMERLQIDYKVHLNHAVRIEMLEEACVSLAAIYWLRRVAHERLGAGSKLAQAGSNVYDTAPTTLNALEVTYRDLLSCDSNTKREIPASRLWVLYVGAVAEQAIKRIDPRYQYFNNLFVEIALQMGLATWENVVVVLKPFLYHESFGPMARQCFVEMVQAVKCAGSEAFKEEDISSSDGDLDTLR